MEIPSGARTPPELLHMWSYITPDPETGCWVWTGACDAQGYPKVGLHLPGVRPHPTVHARREVYIAVTMKGGNLSRKVRLRPVCGNRRCVRPAEGHVEQIVKAKPSPVSERLYNLVDADGERYKAASPSTKLRPEQVRLIRSLYARGGESYFSLGILFDVDASTIGEIVRGESWRHLLR